MAQENKPIPPARPERNDERYDAQRIEQKGLSDEQDPSLYAAEAHPTKPKYTFWRCFLTFGALHMDMCATIPSAMRWPLHVDERVQRATSMGWIRLGCRGECAIKTTLRRRSGRWGILRHEGADEPWVRL